MSTVPMEWAEKYRPKNLTDLVGHSSIVKELIKWAHEWERGVPKDKALILYGKPGVGKTSAAYALAYEMDWDIIELNASDQRTAGIIQKVAGSASKMGTFDGTTGRRLVMLDEADNLHGNYDRGGANALINVIKTTSQPIILIANEFYDITPTLRMSCRPIQFRSVSTTSMVTALKNICRNEGVMIGIGVIERIVEGANGDLRSAINDLQAMAIGKRELEVDDMVTAPRDNKETVFKAMDIIFREHDVRAAQEAAWQVDESPEQLIHWIDENLPIGYTKDEDMAAGYFQLARADQFLGRVRRRQNYKLWRYAGLLMSGGVAAVKTQTYPGYKKYQPPQYFRKMGQTKARRNIRDSLAGKIGEHFHVSSEYVRSDLFVFFKQMMRSSDHSVGLAAELKLNPDEIAFLLESKPSKKVEKIYQAAQQLIQDEVEHDIEMFGRFTHMKEGKEIKTEPDEIPINIEPEEPVGSSNEEEKNQSSLFDF